MFDEYDFINRYPKETVYTLYVHMVDDAKAYENITRKKMLFSIYDLLIEDTSRLDGYVSAEALEFLIQMTQHKPKLNFDSFEEFKLIQELQDSYLLAFYGMPDGFRVPSMIQGIFRNIKVSQRHKDLDVIYHFLNGVLLVKGKVELHELEIIFQDLKPSDMNISLHEALLNLPRIFLKINEPSYQYENSFEHPAFYRDIVIPYYTPVYKHTWDTYTSIGKYGLNIYNPILNDFFNKFSQHKEKIYMDSFVEDFVITTQLAMDFNMSHIMQTFYDIESDVDKAVALYNDVVREIPRWRFKGDPMSLVDRNQIDKLHDQIESDENFNDVYCPCGSGLFVDACCDNYQTLIKNQAVLDEDRAQLFYGLYYLLIHRTNQKYRLHPHFSNIEKFFERLSQPDFVKVADRFFDSPEIITDYIKQYKDHITPMQLEILTGFQHAFKKTFIALRYEHQKLVLLDDQNKHIFLVSGIVSGIALNIPSDVLPQFVETRLIPLNHVITYDVFINQIPVVIGTNLRKELKKVEKQAKVIRNIEDYLGI
ncbi:MAG: hypothetical protein RBT45_01340 [Acholeplasmataceae bacterium]|jgi:hypothetical protein|nr:hypothetical protein [Acholeplasmataceae bacterium]